MKRALRIFISLIASFVCVYLSGYGNLMNDISESSAVTAFFGAVLVLTLLTALLWELYLSLKGKISELTKRIEKLEEKNREE